MTTTITFNAGNASDAKVLHDLARLLALDPLAVGLQEVADRRDLLAKAAKAAGYAHIQRPGGTKGHVALLIRTDAKPHNDRLHQIGKRTHVGKDVAGARKDGWTAAKYILACDVTDPDTGEDLTIATMHLVPSASHSHAASVLLATQAANAAKWLAAQPLPTDLMGDCNGQAGRHEFAPLRKVAAPASAPSRKGGAIDIHWIKGGTALAKALDGYSSDHKPVVADITWAAKPEPAPEPAPPKEAPVSVTKLIHIAEAEVGYHEGRSGGHWNNDEKYAADVPGLAWANHQPWCDTFVNWCYHQAGYLDLVPVVSAGCDISAAGWKKAGRWSEYPAIGAQVFYGTPSDLVHTGLVIDYDDDTITTVEGNTNDSGAAEGDGVYRKVRRRRDPFVVGYGYPKFPEGIKSADPRPKFKREAPKRRPNRPKAPKPAPQPAPEKRPYHEQQALDEARTVRRNAAKHGHKGRARKWADIIARMLGRK